MLKLIEFYKTKHDYKSQFHDEENGDWRILSRLVPGNLPLATIPVKA